MIDEMIVLTAAIENVKISVKRMNILLNSIYYILKLKVNLISMIKLNNNDIYKMKRLITFRDLI
ncbi:hypothetical protein EMPG_09245 [Blastomyces silverae]|uniref:Uncharacterized protein n=1 Tax=Blastomyces silverae TaxID=2060906 RepID=A0A0H1BIR7_9EURO|nr:hypothetical protein EMPG_09245 [Blastomyces silverae]